MTEIDPKTEALLHLKMKEDEATNAVAKVHAVMQAISLLKQDLKDAQGESRLAQSAYVEAWKSCSDRGYEPEPMVRPKG